MSESEGEVRARARRAPFLTFFCVCLILARSASTALSGSESGSCFEMASNRSVAAASVRSGEGRGGERGRDQEGSRGREQALLGRSGSRKEMSFRSGESRCTVPKRANVREKGIVGLLLTHGDVELGLAFALLRH